MSDRVDAPETSAPKRAPFGERGLERSPISVTACGSRVGPSVGADGADRRSGGAPFGHRRTAPDAVQLDPAVGVEGIQEAVPANRAVAADLQQRDHGGGAVLPAPKVGDPLGLGTGAGSLLGPRTPV